MELLEREQFLVELEALLNDVAAGNGRLGLVSGEAGIGKTSLVERFAEEHKAQARFLWGACDALFTPRPLGPLYDIAQQSQGNLLDLLEEEASRASIFSAALDELKGGLKPSIMVIEDVHWADEATLDLLKFLGRRISRINSMIIVTYRDDEVGAEHPLRLVLGDLPHRLVARLRLPPLSEEAVKGLADRASRHIEDLYLVTCGNPFFVTEALQSQEEGVPVTVRDAVLSRAARLSQAARAVLQLVSVVPTRTERWLLDDTIRPDAVALEECITAGMLRDEGEAVAFRHELARRAVEDSLAFSLRQRLHALILKALLTLNAGRLRTMDGEETVSETLRPRGGDALPARLVHHAAQAGDGDAVLKYAPVAAKQAAAFDAHRESASHYQTALKYAERLTPEEQAGLFECRSYECFLTGLLQEALQARRGALEIWKQVGDKRREGDNLRWMSRLSWFSGRKKEAEEYGAEAVRILEGLPPSPELAMAYSNRAQLHMLMDNGQQAVLWGTRAIDLAERFGATETLIHALNNVGSAEMLAGNEQGRIKLEESLRLALRHNFQEHAARDYTNLASFTVIDRNYRLAMHYLDNGIAYTTEHDMEALKLYMMAWRARAHFEQGQWDSAADEASFVLGHYQLSAITKIPALAVLGHLRVRRGDPDAMRLLDEALELALETGELQRIAPVAAARAEFAWLKGDFELVMREANLVSEMAKGHDGTRLRGEFPLAFWVWRAGGTVAEGYEKLYEPYALHMRGDWRAAALAWRETGCPYEEAMALSDGDEEAQLAALQIFERLGAIPAAERLPQALRPAIARRPRQSTKENPAGLTNRQMEVLALIAGGLSNNQIGDRLFISPKTVDHHVSAILSKLGAHTRAEAVALALQSGLINKKIGNRK
jgi:DNA-binding CsgD family transcriptional regulator